MATKSSTLTEEESARPPRERRARVLIYTLAALASTVGLLDSIYLTVEHLAGRSVRCTITSTCSAVLMSDYATIGERFPLAALGALAYFTAFSLSTLAAFGYEGARRLLPVVVALMLATTLWLLYVQAFILRSFCEYCLLSAAVTLALSGLVLAGRFYAR